MRWDKKKMRKRMTANIERLPSQGEIGGVCTASPDIRPSLQSLRYSLASIDFEHESDVETVRNSSTDEWLKLTVIAKLNEHHRECRAPYVRQLEALQKRMQAVAA
jgi:hypothetical protein